MLVTYERYVSLLTHGIVPAGPIPTAQDPEGVYPYESYCETSKRPVLRKYLLVYLENDFLRVAICRTWVEGFIRCISRSHRQKPSLYHV